MNEYRRFTILFFCTAFTAACLISHGQAEGPVRITTGTALSELGETPPLPPPGFATSDEAMAAVRSGEVLTNDPNPPVPDNVVVRNDIEYGNPGNRPLLLDLYSPTDVDKAVPGIVFIHGGSWEHGRKEDYRPWALHFASRGYVVASVQYRLSGEAPFPAAVHDVKAAVRYMRAKADALGVDPNRIAVAGGSAGGHLAMMVAYSPDDKSLDGNSGHSGVSSHVSCIVNIYGPTDMTTPYARGVSETNSRVSQFFSGTYKEQSANYAAGSPIRYVTSDDPPTLILHGTVDALVPINQADILAKKLADVGVPWVYDRLPGWPHSMVLAKCVNDRCLWFMDRFFDRYLKRMNHKE